MIWLRFIVFLLYLPLKDFYSLNLLYFIWFKALHELHKNFLKYDIYPVLNDMRISLKIGDVSYHLGTDFGGGGMFENFGFLFK